jgi:hypothetical protein
VDNRLSSCCMDGCQTTLRTLISVLRAVRAVCRLCLKPQSQTLRQGKKLSVC